MSKAFLSFNDSAMSSGILQVRPELARQLKATTEQFISLSRSANRGSDDEHSGSEVDSLDDPHSSRRVQSGIMESRSYRINVDDRSPSPEAAHHQQDMLPLGYVQLSDDSPGSISPNMVDAAMMDIAGISGVSRDIVPATSSVLGFDSLLQAAGVPYDKMQPRDFGSQVFNVDSMELPTTPDPTDLSALHNTTLPNEIAPSYTYSFQETRFAKRLHRATLERGFHLLSTAHLRPAAFSHVFRFSLLYNTRDALLSRFKFKLSLPPDAPLEYYNTPFIHLGGAGLHYSKRKVTNSYLIKQGPMMPGMRSPKARLEAADPSTGAQPYDIELDLREYEGEWYDAIDVEGFLEEKGVRIEDIGSFAEAVISDESAATSAPSPVSNVFSPPSLSEASITGSSSTVAAATTTTATSVTSPQTPMVSEASLELATARLFPELDGLGQNAGMSMDSEAMGWLMGSGDKTPDFLSSGWANDTLPAPWGEAVPGFVDWSLDDLPPPAGAVTATLPARVAKKTVTIDVNKFINGEFGIFWGLRWNVY